jgi:opacity protein-like surface antigen
MRLRFAFAIAIAAMSLASIAAADVVVVHEHAEPARTTYPYRTGVEMSGYAGVGYGIGVGGRIGATLDSGVYLGGAFTYYTENASFVGGELGYKFWPGYRWELRPYVFLGPAILRVGNEGFGRRADQPEVVLGFQPGFLAACHFGAAYLFADGRVYVTPNPGALALLGGVGVNL